MCYVVDTQCVIANAFFVKKNKKSLDLHDLHKAARKLSASIAQYNAIVSWTKVDLAYAKSKYRDIFIIENDKIQRGPDYQNLLSECYVDTVFNMSLNPEIVSEMRKTLDAQLS